MLAYTSAAEGPAREDAECDCLSAAVFALEDDPCYYLVQDHGYRFGSRR
jgi:hypothetical protein